MSSFSRPAWFFFLCCSLLFVLTAMMSAQNQHIFDKPQSGGYLAAKAFKEGTLRIQANPVNRIAPPSLTCSPAPCAFTPVDASEGGTNPVNEDPIVVNPTNSMNILTAGNDYNCGNIQGYFASTDGGTTWSHSCSGGSGGDGDPIVGFNLSGTAYAGGIQNSGVAIASSTNGGVTFGTFTQVVKPELGSLADKPWMEMDTNPNSSLKNDIYISTTQFASNSNSQIWVAHSSDGGKTFTDVAVSALGRYPTSVNQFSDLAVGSDGTVYLNWINCPASNGNPPYCGAQKTNIMFSKSTDGGTTWSAPSVVATVTLVTDPSGCCFYGQLPNTSERVSNIPSNGVFGSGATAKVTVAFYNWTGTQMQMETATSTNGGTSWNAPVIVNPTSTTGDQFFQWLNINQKNGRVGVTWLDRRNDPSNLSYQPFFAFSGNGGTSYSAGHALSKTKSNPDNDGFGGTFMGDYTGNAWNGKALYQSYMDTTTNTCQDFVTGVQFP